MSDLFETDLSGKVIFRKAIQATNTEIDVKPFAQGVYFLKALVDERVIVNRLVIKWFRFLAYRSDWTLLINYKPKRVLYVSTLDLHRLTFVNDEIHPRNVNLQ